MTAWDPLAERCRADDDRIRRRGCADSCGLERARRQEHVRDHVHLQVVTRGDLRRLGFEQSQVRQIGAELLRDRLELLNDGQQGLHVVDGILAALLGDAGCRSSRDRTSSEMRLRDLAVLAGEHADGGGERVDPVGDGLRASVQLVSEVLDRGKGVVDGASCPPASELSPWSIVVRNDLICGWLPLKVLLSSWMIVWSWLIPPPFSTSDRAPKVSSTLGAVLVSLSGMSEPGAMYWRLWRPRVRRRTTGRRFESSDDVFVAQRIVEADLRRRPDRDVDALLDVQGQVRLEIARR